VANGKFVVSAFAMLLPVFMTDFAKISLSIDNVRPSKKPETWNIGGHGGQVLPESRSDIRPD